MNCEPVAAVLVIAVWKTLASWNRIRVPPPKNSLFSARWFFSQNTLDCHWASNSLSAASVPNRGSDLGDRGVVRGPRRFRRSHHGAAQLAEHLRILERDLDHFRQREIPILGILRVQQRHRRRRGERAVVAVERAGRFGRILDRRRQRFEVLVGLAWKLLRLPHEQPLGATIDVASSEHQQFRRRFMPCQYRERVRRTRGDHRGRTSFGHSAHSASTDKIRFSATRSGARESRNWQMRAGKVLTMAACQDQLVAIRSRRHRQQPAHFAGAACPPLASPYLHHRRQNPPNPQPRRLPRRCPAFNPRTRRRPNPPRLDILTHMPTPLTTAGCQPAAPTPGKSWKKCSPASANWPARRSNPSSSTSRCSSSVSARSRRSAVRCGCDRRPAHCGRRPTSIGRRGNRRRCRRPPRPRSIAISRRRRRAR